MQRQSKIVIPAAILLVSLLANAQAVKTEVWSPAQLLRQAQHLKQLAAQGNGSASETLEKFPHHYTMLAFRSRNGGGELHRDYADLFYILDGSATLMTGGEVVDPKTTAPGEVRGASVSGGTQHEVKAGDLVHIPAGTPHQMLVPDGSTVTYFVVKVQENQ